METGEPDSPHRNGKPDGSDGRGGTESVPEAKSGSRYVYYRLYVTDGPLESINPICSNDHFISRFLSKSVAPPHTVASLKRYLCRIEGFGAVEKCTLYLSISEKAPVEDITRLSLQGKCGPGLSELDPMALVVDIHVANKRPPPARGEPLEQVQDETATRYVHYWLYEEDGEVISKTSFDETDSSLGRVSTLSIPPPHTVASLKAHLIKAEGVPGGNFQLFEEVGGEAAMNDRDSISLLADTYPGVSVEKPIAVVYTSQKKTNASQPQAPVSQLQNQEPIVESQVPISQSEAPGFPKQINATSRDIAAEVGSLSHSATAGESFHTDSLLKAQPYRASIGNSAGGFQVTLTKVDSFADSDLINMVEALNSEIFQGATFMSEELEFDDIVGSDEKVDPRTTERARNTLSSVMFSQLLVKPPKVDPLPLKFALQSIMILRCIQIIQVLCPFEYGDHSDFLRKIYTGIQALGEQAVANWWRGMTLAQLRPSQSYAPYITKDLVSVLVLCGLSINNTRYRTIVQDIQHRMSVLEKATLQIKVALKEGVSSVDIEPFYISSKTQFDPIYMDDVYGNSKRESGKRREGEPILCTTAMGLRRVVRQIVDGQVQTYYNAILKPKVVLASSLMDEAEGQTSLLEQSGG